MTEHFNQLTPAQAERLAMLAEECAEVIQVVGKILRHGYDNYHPENRTFSNRDLLHQELTDLFAVQNEIYAQDRILLPDSETVKAAWIKKLRYSHHQAPDAGGKWPCNECFLPANETCDICGAVGPSGKAGGKEGV